MLPLETFGDLSRSQGTILKMKDAFEDIPQPGAYTPGCCKIESKRLYGNPSASLPGGLCCMKVFSVETTMGLPAGWSFHLKGLSLQVHKFLEDLVGRCDDPGVCLEPSLGHNHLDEFCGQVNIGLFQGVGVDLAQRP